MQGLKATPGLRASSGRPTLRTARTALVVRAHASQPSSSNHAEQQECSSSGSGVSVNQPSALGRLGKFGLSSALSAFVLVPNFGGFGGNGGNRGGGGGGGGGGGSGGQGQPDGGLPLPLYELAEESSDEKEKQQKDDKRNWKNLVTDSEDLEEKPGERSGTNRCVEIVIEGWPDVGNLPTADELKDLLTVQEGHIFEKQDLLDDRRKLEIQYEDYIAEVEIRTEYVDGKSNHQRVVYKFTPHQFRGINAIDIKGAALMPASEVERICNECLPKQPYMVDIAVMDKVRNRIEQWYQSRGLPFCYVGFFDGMDDGILRANVTEAKIDNVSVRFVRPKLTGDSELEYSVYDEGKVVKADKIIEASGFQRGHHYHVEDGYDAMNSIFACGLLEDINIEPEQDPSDVNKINVKIRCEEVQPKSMELDLDWSFQLKNGIPSINRQSLIPGGSVEVSHENLFGNSESATLSLSASDWRNPSADLGFSVAYSEPFYKPHTTRNAQLFNTRKTSTIFTPGGESEVPPVFVDRFGLKGWTSQITGQDNKVEHALMLQLVSTLDENGQVVAKGTKVQRGYYADNGPPTTNSGNGRDLSLSYQGFFALDNVRFINGNQLGERMLFQVDQGLNPSISLPGGRKLGLSGGIYNRATASYTKFLEAPFLPKLTTEQLWKERKAPNTVVLHAKAGNALGDVAAYDYFSLGGPYSVRGYSHGEIGAARRFLELATEVRVPLKNYGLPGTAYGFVEYATDLGSGRELNGNPTEYYRKPGRGMSYGLGLKALGACRFEYARDCNAGTGTFLVNFGERF
ncbi:hypothetical protein CHLRE_03g175200v5 [Chlamydomonas reinhardtii]|uniref:Bacterial surface antigen (D15) domain-containing protein n=1 Tax=Chlamydomonas reinhardtii TaxID=3055 RepID=A8IE32_CHLRE|nr:uncharacterized protein CHLRE_03g175200v5 [Chlamydomonas reinhardtii]PNW85183.1 hypothetical protein CHLRE_03g175200v5 [Chlamydomonas reinhardtii]7XZI_7 Chain 7, Toc75 [Chlamydomonas reinhardtii]7XZJ_7 Chain 7, Toc75 [Chlamydomonas reinhardtii]|eukprot:XP_001703281.1 75 kDa chloroplast membrane translocon [Chlamydomonas reinhardtii]